MIYYIILRISQTNDSYSKSVSGIYENQMITLVQHLIAFKLLLSVSLMHINNVT